MSVAVLRVFESYKNGEVNFEQFPDSIKNRLGALCARVGFLCLTFKLAIVKLGVEAAFFEEGGEALIQQAFPLLWTDGFTRLYQIC